MTVLDAAQLQEIMDTAFPGANVPLIEAVNDDSVTVCQPIALEHGRPGGTVSGPIMMMLADTTAWVAVLSHIGPVLLAVTTSLHIDFLRKPDMADLVAQGTILKLGRKLAVVDVAIRSRGRDEMVAKAQVTYSIPSNTPSTSVDA